MTKNKILTYLAIFIIALIAIEYFFGIYGVFATLLGSGVGLKAKLKKTERSLEQDANKIKEELKKNTEAKKEVEDLDKDDEVEYWRRQ